jgi:hypothetical protein
VASRANEKAKKAVIDNYKVALRANEKPKKVVIE